MFPQTVQFNEANVRKLTVLYNKAYQEIVKELETATSFGVYNRTQILNQIEAILKELGEDINYSMKQHIERYYTKGASEAVSQLKAVDGEIAVSKGFNKIHKEAIASLVDSSQNSFGESLSGVNRSVKNVISKTIQEQLTAGMAVGKISGKTLPQLKAILKDVLEREGLNALVDKAGRKWTLDRYTEMLIRTKSVEARNRGMANRIVENGYDLVQVSSHGATDVCGEWEGKILSVNGSVSGYPSVLDAEASGLFHPNCKHAINVIVPELAELTKAYIPDSPTMSGKEFYSKYYE